ncbi:MAG: zf-HC2 domain-containing protein [Thermogemmata sp.]|uniref:Zf-HC2 domain-containing protein n=1 Tax=Thermogemmata fonticola TaxID=2755323 RepID=A0A7V9AD64_9BACT|nr:zf-HC2 domain-containing protein [Thermogemmata fonticola]MBA2227482.1 zf-HC2 domain-containing protein [Thermogemmata fonticola]MCX8138937.1 zf-HC2 domain-containing protein [Gemmataceae bacterium]
MTCEELLQALNEYVDGTLDLSQLECQQFAEHLKGCHPCQVVVDTIRGTIQLYRAGEPYPLPPEFATRLQQLLQARWQAKFPASAPAGTPRR